MKNLFAIFIACSLVCIKPLSLFGQTKPQELVKQADRYAQKAEYNQAIATLKRAGEGFQKTDNWQMYVTCQNQIGEHLIRVGKLDDALAVCQKMATYIANKQAKTSKLQADMLNVTGEVYMNRGQSDLALKHFQQALEIYTRLKDQAGTAQCYSNLGIVYNNTNNQALAEEYHLKALNLRKSIFGNQHLMVAASYNDLGLIYNTSDPEKASEYYEKALEIYEREKQQAKVANTYSNMALIKQHQRVYPEALDFFDQALQIRKKLYKDDHPNVAFVYINIGRVYAAQGKAEKALEDYGKALSIYQKNYGGKHPDIANIYNYIGAVFDGKNDYKEAIANYQKALIANVPEFNDMNISTNPGLERYYNADVLMNSLSLKAQALEARHFGKTLRFKDLKVALETLEKCDELLEKIRRLRTNQNDKIALGKIGSEIYEDGIRISMAMSDVSLNKKYYYQKAFYFAEKSKSAVLLDAIIDTDAKQFAGIPANLLAKEKELKGEISYYEQQLASGLEAAEEKEFRDKLFALKRSYDDFTKRLEKDYPDYFNLKFNTLTVTVPQIQQQLDKESAMLLYFIGQKTNRLYYFFISRNKFKAIDLPLIERFDRYLISMRNRLYFRRNFQQSGRILYKQLFPQRIPGKIKNLIIIPDGRMGTIPFEALLTSKVKPQTSLRDYPYLIKKKGITYSYSATLFAQSKEDEPASADLKDILLMAPINFDRLNNLPASEAEVKRINQLFTAKQGKTQMYLLNQANEAQMKSKELKKYRYVHLATHGVVDEASPELSRVFLAKNDKEDGSLYFGEIFNLELNANLVALSACETGLGKLSKGEGIIGLTRALLYAGAKSVMVSLWSVADESTSQLMIYFYEYLLSGKDKYEALRQAKLKLIREGVNYKDEPLSAYYWAPFVLIGK
ncbi:hypothetical protein BKI52_09405 [marine bacterium AO1-C]|nr:hypothetical protein BKI52_09405 [marine bacterium AO1-C]